MFWSKKEKLNPPPQLKTNEYKTILTLLDGAERWRNVGDKELEKKTWLMIWEKAAFYADGGREEYETVIETKCGKLIIPYVEP